MRFYKPLLLLALLFRMNGATVGAQDTLRILFIGNSMTFVNDLPDLLVDLAASNGKVILTAQNTPGGYFLSDHVTNSTSLNLMSQGFDYIVVQEQSSGNIQPANPSPAITRPIEIIDSLAKAHCSKLLLYATPGYPETYPGSVYTYQEMQQNIIDNYMLTAHSVRAACLPTGHAFREIVSHYPMIPNMWISPTDYHPGLNGQYLHACVLFSVLYSESAEGLPAPPGISVSDKTILQQIAWQMTQDSAFALGYHYLDEFTTGFSSTTTGLVLNVVDTSSSTTNKVTWDFGDGTAPVVSVPQWFQPFANVSHEYLSPGCYMVKHTAEWGNCMSQTDSVLICVGPLNTDETNPSVHQPILYPNPGNGMFQISHNGYYNNANYVIVDIMGRTVNSGIISPEVSIVDISHLPAGFYYVLIGNETTVKICLVKE